MLPSLPSQRVPTPYTLNLPHWVFPNPSASSLFRIKSILSYSEQTKLPSITYVPGPGNNQCMLLVGDSFSGSSLGPGKLTLLVFMWGCHFLEDLKSLL